MSSVTTILHQIEQGEPGAAEHLLPLVYAELRRLAERSLSQERAAGHEATSLVHEAYMRLAGTDKQNWNSRGHFYASAAEAMRRILIEDARRRRRPKHGGDRARVELDADVAPQADRTVEPGHFDDVLAIDEALTKFAALEPAKAQLVKLRYFGGLSLEEGVVGARNLPGHRKAPLGVRTCLAIGSVKSRSQIESAVFVIFASNHDRRHAPDRRHLLRCD